MGGESFRVDESRWPVVGVHWTKAISIDDLEAYVAVLRGFLERRQRFGLVVDGSRTDGISPVARKHAAAISKELSAPMARWVIAEGIVLANPLHRGILTAIEWFMPPGHPRRTFARVEDAKRWVEDRVADAASPTERAHPRA